MLTFLFFFLLHSSTFLFICLLEQKKFPLKTCENDAVTYPHQKYCQINKKKKDKNIWPVNCNVNVCLLPQHPSAYCSGPPDAKFTWRIKVICCQNMWLFDKMKQQRAGRLPLRPPPLPLRFIEKKSHFLRSFLGWLTKQLNTRYTYSWKLK